LTDENGGLTRVNVSERHLVGTGRFKELGNMEILRTYLRNAGLQINNLFYFTSIKMYTVQAILFFAYFQFRRELVI
jgi:hypothetical protein